MIWIGSSSPCPFCALPRHAVRVFPGAGAHFIHACTLELCKHVTTWSKEEDPHRPPPFIQVCEPAPQPRLPARGWICQKWKRGTPRPGQRRGQWWGGWSEDIGLGWKEWGKCDAEERTQSRLPKPKLRARETLTGSRASEGPAAAGAHPLPHVTRTAFPSDARMWVSPFASAEGRSGILLKVRGQGAERTYGRRGLDVRLAVTRAPPAGGNGGKARGRARGSPLTACALGGPGRGRRALVRRQSWLQWRGRRRPRGRMARGWLPQQPAGRQARPRWPRPAPGPCPSASPRTPCGRANAAMALESVRSRPARWSALPWGRACRRAAGWVNFSRVLSSSSGGSRASLFFWRGNPRHSPPACLVSS